MLYRLSYLGVRLPVTGRGSVTESGSADNAAGIRIGPEGFPGRVRNLAAIRSSLTSWLILASATALLAQAGAAPTPVVRSPGNAEWASTLAEARARAASQQKFVFVEFTQAQCGNCERMDHLLYPAFDFEALLIPMVPIKLEIDSEVGKALAARYEVRETPSVLITTPEGRLVFLMQGFRSAPEFYAHAHSDLDAYRRFARKVEGQDVSKLSGREALDTGRELFQRQDSAAALPRLERATRAPDTTPEMHEDALELAAAAELDLGKSAASSRTIEQLIATTKSSDRRERAELFQAQIPLSENKPAEALKRFEAFKRAHPQSAYMAGVDAMIQKLLDARSR